MNSIFEINAKEIERLEDIQFVDLMNRLLCSEGYRAGIAPGDINTNLRINDPDGGVDSRIVAHKKLENRWIPAGLNVWQFKSGEIPPSKIKKEFNKPGVQDAIRQAGTYCLVVGKEYGDKPRKSREEKLEECFREISLLPKYKFFTATHVARWASEHPAIALLSYFERPVGDLMRFETWANQEVHQIPFQPEEKRAPIIDEIKKVIQNGSQIYFVRIEGLAGVGKTRLVMESVRMPNLTERVLYAISPSAIPQGFFSWVEHNPNVNLILVVDECDEDNAEKFKQHAERCQGRLKLISTQ